MGWERVKTATKSISIKSAGLIYETNVEIKPGEVTEFKYKIQS